MPVSVSVVDVYCAPACRWAARWGQFVADEHDGTAPGDESGAAGLSGPRYRVFTDIAQGSEYYPPRGSELK